MNLVMPVAVQVQCKCHTHSCTTVQEMVRNIMQNDPLFRISFGLANLELDYYACYVDRIAFIHETMPTVHHV